MRKVKDIAIRVRESIKPDDIKSGTSYVGLEHIHSEGRIEHVIVSQGELKSNKFIFEEGDVLYGKLRPYLRKIAIAKTDGICSTDIIPLRIKPGNSNQYLAFLIRSKRLVDFANSRTSGANLPRISPSEILELPIPVPSFETQHLIAHRLDLIDRLRRSLRAEIKAYEELGESVFLEMFGDVFQGNVVPLKQSIRLIGGFAFKSKDFVGEGIPLIKIGTVNKGFFDTSLLSFLPDCFAVKYSKWIVNPNDLLMSLTGTVGKQDYGNVEVSTDEYPKYLLNQRVAKIEPIDKKYDKLFLRYMMGTKFFKRKITSLSRGVRQANISNKDILDLKVKQPDLALQHQFAARIRHLDGLKARAEAALAEADDLFNGVLQEVFG